MSAQNADPPTLDMDPAGVRLTMRTIIAVVSLMVVLFGGGGAVGSAVVGSKSYVPHADFERHTERDGHPIMEERMRHQEEWAHEKRPI